MKEEQRRNQYEEEHQIAPNAGIMWRGWQPLAADQANDGVCSGRDPSAKTPRSKLGDYNLLHNPLRNSIGDRPLEAPSYFNSHSAIVFGY